jgi:hypothetical protein
MSKKNDEKPENNEAANGEVANGSEGTKKISPAELRTLFEHVEAFDATIAEHEAKLRDAQAARSLAIKAIFEGTGGKTGPFKWKDRSITIVSRKSKDKSTESWYFREPKDRDTIDVG